MEPEETPAEGDHQKVTSGQRIPPAASFQFEVWKEAGCHAPSHLNWQGGGGIDESSPGKTSSSTGVSQKGDRGEVR